MMSPLQVKPRANIGSICLPSALLELEPGTLATVTGWGRLGVTEGAPHSATLQVTNMCTIVTIMCTIVTSSKKLDWKVNITYMYITHNLVLTLGDLELTAIFLLTLFPPRLWLCRCWPVRTAPTSPGPRLPHQTRSAEKQGICILKNVYSL